MIDRTLWLLTAANFAAAGAGMMMAGLLQLIAGDMHWSAQQAGHLITTYALGFAIGAPLLGALLGTWCRKQVVALGLSLVALGSLGTVLTTGSPWIEAARVVAALGASMAVPSVSAVAAYLHPEDRPRALARVLLGMTLAMVLGVPLATLAADLWGWRAPVAAGGAIALLAALAIKLLLPGGIVVPPVPLSAWKSLLGNAAVMPLFGVSLIVVAATFSLYAFIAPFVATMAGLGARELSGLLLWFGLASLAANALLGPVARIVGERRLMLATLLALAAALAATGLGGHHAWPLVALFALWALCSSFFGTLQQSRVVAAAPALGSATLALNTSATFLGQAAGTLIGGQVVASQGLRALPWTAGALALTGLMLLWAASRRQRSP